MRGEKHFERNAGKLQTRGMVSQASQFPGENML
jgi:hypothetical protein